jgi:hypothetical protein
MKKLLVLVLILASCSSQKQLIRKQKKANKLEFEINELKKELNLPLDTTIIKLDTIISIDSVTKYDTIKLKCNDSNQVVYITGQKTNGEIITKTKYIYKDKIINKEIGTVKKEIIYKEKEFNKTQMILMGVGFLATIILIFYFIGNLSFFIIRFANKFKMFL